MGEGKPLIEEAHAEAVVSYSGVTTADGNAGGTTLVDATLTQANDYWNDQTVLILSGACKGQSRDITDFAGGTITVSPAFDSQIVSGVRFVILPYKPSSAEVSDIKGTGFVKDIDSLVNNRDINFNDGIVWIDAAFGSSGTDYPKGTAVHPVDNLADALTIASSRNIRHLHMLGSFTLSDSISGYTVYGEYLNTDIDLNSKSVGGTVFHMCDLWGTVNGSITCFNCSISDVTDLSGRFKRCTLSSDIYIKSSSYFEDCYFRGNAYCDFSGISGGLYIFSRVSGVMALANLTHPTAYIAIFADGLKLSINSNCTAGVIEIYGSAQVIDNSGAGCTVNIYSIEQHDTYGLSAIKELVDDLETRLTAARAGYLDELAAANIPADIDTLLARLTAIRAGYLDELDFDLDARLGTPAGGSIAADIATIDSIVDELKADSVYHMTFWSDVQPTVIIPAVAADLDFPDVVVADLPSGITIIRAVAILKYAQKEDTSGSANAINGVNKGIRVKKSTGAWGTDDVMAIDIPDNTMLTAASTKEGGDAIEGNNDISGEVDGNATYNFRSEQTNRGDAIVADGANLILRDVQIGIKVYFTA